MLEASGPFSPFFFFFPILHVLYMCACMFLYMWVHVNVYICAIIVWKPEVDVRNHPRSLFHLFFFFFFEGRSQSNPELVGLANLP